jgi:uncharacterized protein HemX
MPPVSVPVTSPEPATPPSVEEEKPLEELMGPTPDAAPPQSGVQPAPPVDVTKAPMGGQKSSGKKSSKKLIVLGTVLILVLLAAGGGAYVYLKNANKKTATTNTPVVQTETKPKATAADVDAASKALDTNLASVDDSKDFTPNDLSDTTLGL